MTSFWVQIGSKTVDHPNLYGDGYCVINPVIEQETNAHGTMKFTLPVTHPYYNDVKKVGEHIIARNDSESIFNGRIIQYTRDFYGNLDVYCEGEMAFLCDSVMMPFHFTGTVEEFLKKVLEVHNGQVNASKRIALKSCTMDEKVDITTDSAQSCWDVINSNLIGSFDGYMSVTDRKLSYLKEITKMSKQSVKFAENLLDLSEFITGADTVNVLIPYGASITQKNASTKSVDYYLDQNLRAVEDSSGKYYTKEVKMEKGCTYHIKLTDAKLCRIALFPEEVSMGQTGSYIVNSTATSYTGDYVYTGDGGTMVIYVGSKALGLETWPELEIESVYGENSVDKFVEEPTENKAWDGNHVTIRSVNNGKPYIKSEEGIEARGEEIWGSFVFSEIASPKELLEAAKEKLNEGINSDVTLTLTALDLHLVDVDISSIHKDEYVEIYSVPHGIHKRMVCSKVHMEPKSPDNSTVTLGSNRLTLTQSLAGVKRIESRIEALEGDVDYRLFKSLDAVGTGVKKTSDSVELVHVNESKGIKHSLKVGDDGLTLDGKRLPTIKCSTGVIAYHETATGTCEIRYIGKSPFDSAPTVIVGQVFNSANLVVSNVTVDGFDVKVPGVGSEGTREFPWIAIG